MMAKKTCLVICLYNNKRFDYIFETHYKITDSS